MTAQVNDVLSHWGPAPLVCFTLVVGFVYQNARMNDLKDAMNTRFNDLRHYIKSEVVRLEQRIDAVSDLVRK